MHTKNTDRSADPPVVSTCWLSRWVTVTSCSLALTVLFCEAKRDGGGSRGVKKRN
jgi:hypothetical protein